MLKEIATQTIDDVQSSLGRLHLPIELVDVGNVTRISAGTVEVTGIERVSANELLQFPHGLLGIAADVAEDRIGAILLGASTVLRAGDDVLRTRRVVSTPVGAGLLGRVVDPLGRPLDGKGPIEMEAYWPVERPVPPIMERAPVSEPLHTGIKAIDAAIPIGRGQRELIIGDRQTGKSVIAVDTIVNQKNQVVCIYCAIGQRSDAVARVIAKLRDTGALKTSVVVVAGGEEAPGLQFIAPYAATSIAEWFMERGNDVLIVYDDLTRHARAYRELSLLLRRPPGREAFPGDIFYIHARLLERATHLSEQRGGGSLTALPIIETQSQNLADYIPTNLISITDGQIYLSPTLFHRGQLPAVDIGKSVSRVGGKAQLPALRSVSAPLKLAYSQFEELETFARFGTRLDDETRQKLERGKRVREILKQPETSPCNTVEEVALFFAATGGMLDHLSLDQIHGAESAIGAHLKSQATGLGKHFEDSGSIEAVEDELRRAVEVALDRNGLSLRGGA